MGRVVFCRVVIADANAGVVKEVRKVFDVAELGVARVRRVVVGAVVWRRSERIEGKV